jgi:hypothetical protein
MKRLRGDGLGELLLPFSPESSVCVFGIRAIKIKIYGTAVWALVLCGCITWPVILREENTLRLFVKRVLPKKFGTKMKEISGS